MDMRYYKICIVGESDVGKSSIATRYVHEKFDPDSTSTIGAAYYCKKLIYQNSNVHLQMWDTAGQERYRTITPLYYRHAAAVVLVIDNTNIKSNSIANYWIKAIKQHIPDIPIYIAINKSDLPSQLADHCIPSILELYPDVKYKFVSAKNNNGIDELFSDLVESVYNNNNVPVNTQDTIILNPVPNQKKWFSKCSIF